MILVCPAPDGSIALTAPTICAFSEAAETVDRAVKEGLLHLARPRMELLVSEIGQVVKEAATEAGEDVAPVDIETASAAFQFAYSLPWSLPTPEVAPDSDGDISFDWLGPSGKMFSVSVNKAGRVAYAGRFSDKSKIHGIEQLSTACPQTIIRGIARAIA